MHNNLPAGDVLPVVVDPAGASFEPILLQVGPRTNRTQEMMESGQIHSARCIGALLLLARCVVHSIEKEIADAVELVRSTHV